MNGLGYIGHLEKKNGSNRIKYATVIKGLKIQELSGFDVVKFSNDTVLILKVRKSRSERELLNLGKNFRKPSIILVGGFC
ncbi:hypothetical protein HMPREF1863_00025 [Aedoeadaptatus coxii]|uniref:Uncharacterized protein n=1 Tax=Aedoeadaptatus coxii TaxID=755172 RepID=A0A134ALH1_9FIRM|nr:hypothetical protein HMPREF1863_00025 [Peptoniphilus coxii]